MQISTTRFGSVSLEESQIVTFAEGLPAFEDARRFVLLPHPGASAHARSPFQWLQCADGTPGADALAFPVIDPWLIDPGYAPTIPATTLRELDLEPMLNRASFWAVVTVPRDHPEQATVNMLAPLLINRESRQARQVAQLGDKYQLRTPLKPVAAESRSYRMESVSAERTMAVAAG